MTEPIHITREMIREYVISTLNGMTMSEGTLNQLIDHEMEYIDYIENGGEPNSRVWWDPNYVSEDEDEDEDEDEEEEEEEETFNFQHTLGLMMKYRTAIPAA